MTRALCTLLLLVACDAEEPRRPPRCDDPQCRGELACLPESGCCDDKDCLPQQSCRFTAVGDAGQLGVCATRREAP